MPRFAFIVVAAAILSSGNAIAGGVSFPLDAVKVQLRHEPLRETRNRKQLRPNPLAPWELRVGALRLFYEVDALEPDLVNVLAIGIKRGHRLIVAGKEIHI